MKKPNPLDHKLLRKNLDASQLDFKTTAEVRPIADLIGQERAMEAIHFGIGIKRQGYNLYAMGPSGLGKLALITRVLKNYANKLDIPADWCYIHNFELPDKPIALKLPIGYGLMLQKDMRKLVETAGTRILAVLESDEYTQGMKKITDEYARKRKQNAKNKSEEKVDISPQLYKEQHAKEKKLQTKLVSAAIKPLINKLKKRYAKFTDVINYLIAVKKDIITHVSELIKPDEKTNLLTFSLENPVLTKYKINLLVDNSNIGGVPVIFEDQPCYSTLICRVEHVNYFGSAVTNFTLIKPGSLHRANGGYLIIEARKLKKNREAWEALKSALYANEIKVKPLEHEMDSIKPLSLEPEPIPLRVKVVLLGDRNTYYDFCQYDADFLELFKVAVDFDEQIERNKKNIYLYARMIASIIQKEKLRHFSVKAIAAIIDHSTRLAEDVEKMSTYVRAIEDLVVEANYWASTQNRKYVEAQDVKQAINAQIHRMDRARELYYEDIHRNFVIIRTEGETIGQVNCLSVRRVGNFSFGHPTRVTARVRLGNGKLIDIQREIKMAGPLHTKAGLIISNFLASRFNRDQLFSLTASIAFEQLYSWTDGDSASVGELCALLSALADAPIKQSLAVTGSIDQYGEVQAIGGVNEKIEGFFDVCNAKGLNGQQGVLIPKVNIQNLMLREDVVLAAKSKQFFIYPISTVDEAIYLLTGLIAGGQGDEKFPEGSLYSRIEKRLETFSKNRVKKNPPN